LKEGGLGKWEERKGKKGGCFESRTSVGPPNKKKILKARGFEEGEKGKEGGKFYMIDPACQDCARLSPKQRELKGRTERGKKGKKKEKCVTD